MENTKLEISINPWNVLQIIGIFLLLGLLWAIKSVVVMFFIAFILASTLRPLINKLQDRAYMPRPLATTLVFALIIFVLSTLTYVVTNDITRELRILAQGNYWEQMLMRIETIIPGDQTQIVAQIISSDAQTINNYLNLSSITTGTGWIVNIFSGTFGILITLLTIFVVSFYMLQRRDDYYEGLLSFLPPSHRANAKEYAMKIESRLGSWMLAQIILMFTIGLLTYVGLSFPSLFLDGDVYTIGKFALAMALIAGLLEIVPNIGPTITFIVGVIVSIATGGDAVWGQTLYVGIFFILLQQLENILLVPKVIKETVGIDPIVTILGIIGGSIVFGVIGAVLVVPLIAIVQIIFDFIVKEREIMSKESKITEEKLIIIEELDSEDLDAENSKL